MLSIFPLIDALREGRVIRHGVARLLHGLAWLTLATGGVAVIALLKTALSDRLPVEATIAGLLCAGLVGLTSWVMARIFFYHAVEITALDEGAFFMIPIAASLLRLLGELLAAWWGATGIIAALAALIAGPFAGVLLEAAELPSTFLGLWAGGLLGALAALAASLLLGAAVLLISYLAAELLVVAADVAHKAGRLVELAHQMSGGELQPVPAPAPRTCPHCGRAIPDPPTRFCEQCGARL